MQWDSSPGAGFTTGTPWLPLVDQDVRSVAGQRDEPGSLLSLYRELIALRRELPLRFEAIADVPGVVAFRRGDRLVAINLSSAPQPVPRGEVLLQTARDAVARDGSLAPHAGAVLAVA
jgi:glycosidase